MKQRWIRPLVAMTAAALVAAACTDGDATPDPEEAGADSDDAVVEDAEEDAEDELAAPVVEDDGVLDFGTILPESGPLAFLGPPQIESVKLAVEEINAAGGVLGNDVTLELGDEAGDPMVAAETADRLLRDGVDAIIGAAASEMSLAFADAVTDAGALQCSASNTGLTFTNADHDGRYFRTAPSDILQGPVLATTIIGDGNANPALLARDDDYGIGLLAATVDALEEQGATVAAEIVFDPTADDFEAEVLQLAGSGADSVVLITFDEGVEVLRSMIEGGFGPADLPVYGADGIRSNELAALVDPEDVSVLDGLRGTAPGAPPSGSAEVNGYLERFQEQTGLEDTAFAAEAYDCTVIVALAARLANSTSASDIAASMVDVTTPGGTVCGSYTDCAALLDAGEAITYATASGVVLRRTESGNGEPTSGYYEVWEIDETGTVNTVANIESSS